jgi:hypothetical protein
MFEACGVVRLDALRGGFIGCATKLMEDGFSIWASTLSLRLGVMEKISKCGGWRLRGGVHVA